MATLSTPEINNLRTKKHSSKFYMSVLTPRTLLTALVNNGSIARGDRSIAYDSGTSDDYSAIEAGQTLWVGTSAGANDVGKIRVKSITGTAASGTITVDENGIDWIDNLYLTIKHDYEIWPVRASTRSGVDYKFYDTAYSNQNNQPNPVAIAGPHQVGFLSGGSLALNVPVGDSYAIASGAAITSKTVTVSPSSGASVGAESGGVIPITYTTAGEYWIKATATDSNGQTQTTYRIHFVYDSDNLPYLDFDVSSLSGDWNSGGWRFNVTVYGDVTLDDFPDGAICVLWREGRIDDTESYINIWTTGDNILCSGYIRNENDTDQLGTRDGGVGQVSFTVETPESVINNRYYGTESVEAVATPPANWGEYASWCTAGRTIDFLFKWHSTVKECVDIYGLTDNSVGNPGGEFIEPSLLQQANSQANRIFAKVISDRIGRLHLSEDIQMFNQTARNAEDKIFSLQAEDLGGEVNIARANEKKTAAIFMSGGYWTGSTITDYVSMIGGYLDGADPVTIFEPSGAGIQDINQKLATSQTDNDEKVGRIMAAENNQLKEIRVPLRGDYSGAFDIDPQLGWYVWDVPNATLNRQLELQAISMLCRRVEHEIDVGQGTILTNAIFEAEAFGPDGIIADYPTEYPVPPLPSPNWTLPTTADIDISISEAITVNDTPTGQIELSGSTWTWNVAYGADWHSSDGTYMYGHHAKAGSNPANVYQFDMASQTETQINDITNTNNADKKVVFQGDAASPGVYDYWETLFGAGAVFKWDGSLNSWTSVLGASGSSSIRTGYLVMSASRMYYIMSPAGQYTTNITKIYYTTDGSTWVLGTIDNNGFSARSPAALQFHYASIDRGLESYESNMPNSYVFMSYNIDGTLRGMVAELTTNGMKYLDDQIDVNDRLLSGHDYHWRWDASENGGAGEWQYRTSPITDWDTGWTTPALVGGNEIAPTRTLNLDRQAGYYFDGGTNTLYLHWFEAGAWTTTGETIQVGYSTRNEVIGVHRANTGEVVSEVRHTFDNEAVKYFRDIDIP